MYRRVSRRKQRASQVAVLNCPRLREPRTSDPPRSAREPERTSPEIPLEHPTWWLVRRAELNAQTHERTWVLIGQFRDEEDAMRFALREAWECEVTRWGDRRPVWRSGKRLRVALVEREP